MHANPGILKLELMLKGVKLDPSVFAAGDILPVYRIGPHCLGNLDMVLPGGTWVSVPYQEEFVKNSPLVLKYDAGKYILHFSDGHQTVTIVPHPKYYDDAVSAQARVGEIACVHGGYVSLAIGGHRYLQETLVDEEGSGNRPGLVLSVDETLNVLEKITSRKPVDVVTLSCWSPDPRDGGILQIEPYIRAIKKNFGVLLLVEVHLPQTTDIIDATYAMGADSVCYHIGNLCTHGVAAPSSGDRHKEIEMALLRHAVDVFPGGSILAHITCGDPATTDTRADIDELCAARVLPILTVESLAQANRLGFNAEKLAPLFGYLFTTARRHKIKMNWFSKLAPFVAPIEGHFFAGGISRLERTLMNLYQIRFFGGSLSAALSNLRRKLRVREVRPK